MSGFAPLFDVVILGIATGAASFVLTKASILNPMHEWLETKAPFFGEMLDCPLCTSHWVALFFTLVYHPLLLVPTDRPTWLSYILAPVDYLVTVLVMVVVASVAARIIYSAYKPMMMKVKETSNNDASHSL